MKQLVAKIRDVFRPSARDCLLMDGMHSCVYLPKGTYRHLAGLLNKSLERDPKAENSLRFLWTKRGGDMLLVVNPGKEEVEMTCTHGLAKDSKGRIIIPCPYIQHIYHVMDLPPEWCGSVEVEYEKPVLGGIGTMRLKRKV